MSPSTMFSLECTMTAIDQACASKGSASKILAVHTMYSDQLVGEAHLLSILDSLLIDLMAILHGQTLPEGALNLVQVACI